MEFLSSPMVTVIIPAYNAEKYILRSVKSITDQSYSNISVIVVDDGSSDKTAEIVRSLAESDKRIRLVSVKNGGPASARNFGLNTAAPGTDFFMFCDADDELCFDAIEKSVAAASCGADFVIFGYTINNPDGSMNRYYEPERILTQDTLGGELVNLYKANLLNQVWGKLYKAELIRKNNVCFPDFKWGEDRFFVFDCLENAKTISVLSYCGYKYNMSPGDSLISGFYERKPEICILIDSRIVKMCSKYNVAEQGSLKYMFVKSIFSCFATLFSPSCCLDSNGKRGYIKEVIQNEYISARCSGVTGGIAAWVIAEIIKSKNVDLNFLAARAVFLAGKLFPKTFQKIKHKK